MDLTGLNNEQRQAVTHRNGPALVVAGAGTGKTTVITRRIAHLIDRGWAKPSEILALTFTDKAAREMEERVDELLPYGQLDTKVMTFHAFGDQLLRRFGLEIGLAQNYTLLSSAQQLLFLRQHIDELELDYYAPIANPDSLLANLISYFSRLKDELILPHDYHHYITKLKHRSKTPELLQEIQRQSELARAYETYIALCRQEGLIDFGDQILLAIQLLEVRPSVLQRLRQEIKYILVDEYQDTNFAQNRLLKLLAGDKPNLMVVGDDDQSIYRFRGAAISNILEFMSAYPNAKQIVLNQNYRSTQEILDASYQLIKYNNPNRLEVKNNISKYLLAQSSGPHPKVRSLPSFGLEADNIAHDIERRLGENPQVSVAVLIRKHNQAKQLIPALIAQGVNYVYQGKLSLYDQSEIKNLLYLLQYLDNPTDSEALYYALASPLLAYNKKALSEQTARARSEHRLLEEVVFGDDMAEELEGIRSKIADWRERSSSLTIGQLAFAILEETGRLQTLTQDSANAQASERAVSYLARFFRSLAEYEQVAQDKGLHAYILGLNALLAAGETIQISTEADYEANVQILTVHQAKGLEFDLVYIFDLTAGTFPATKRAEALPIPDDLLSPQEQQADDWQLAEERRLMYVAMTRARQELFLTYSVDHGGKLAKKPSVFIVEALGKQPPVAVAPTSQHNLDQIALFRAPLPVALEQKFSGLTGRYLELTPHQIDDYLLCPENFRYKYILRVPQPPNANMMYGTAIHFVISAYNTLRKTQHINLSKLQEILDTQWQNAGFISVGQEQRRYHRARQTIASFFEREQTAGRHPDYIERSFKVRLDDLKVRLNGRYDAVYAPAQGRVEIRDYKTSQVTDQAKADKKAATSVQLAVYALAWQLESGRLPDLATLDFVDTGIIGTAEVSEALIDSIKLKIAKVAAGIRAGDYRPGSNHRYCIHGKVEL